MPLLAQTLVWLFFRPIRASSWNQISMALCFGTSLSRAASVACRLKTLGGLTPYEYIREIWTSEPDRFILNPIRRAPGPST